MIVLNFNGKQHLPVCLTALCNQTYTPIEILLVDNGSTDGSLDLVHENFRGVRTLALRENLGFCGG
ncbi:MAG TPA: glycosyltransferase, partial [Bellilinea sp.]|nr:glycosyltransferase [Bellilinea sp.]